MKQKKTIVFLLLSLLGLNHLNGQEKKNTINISGIIAHYTGIYDYPQYATTKGSYVFFLNPGAEVLYWRQISHILEFGTGINLQKVQVESKVDVTYAYTLRFQYRELSVPILLRKKLYVEKPKSLVCDRWYLQWEAIKYSFPISYECGLDQMGRFKNHSWLFKRSFLF